ncbi:lysophospholipid acyltransferase family protein [Merismopedia glauca]|uniref:1-acyl-sn-glycerol-3-phosphate acyltransferase n=1 Tax=Merismopedia glauca CCAP 1448/3 TaxID=1296344 RepID=A0A2T1C3H5_9CYAN|nr:1-acyl-sn-glycerol-3-phosphate acyltransferase [Merismopedia glauca]PSB02825.1 1-acyl-sn-glycerol-3-phosphate acyltransferase [Merismopedia glauca CCAP 1448/3]
MDKSSPVQLNVSPAAINPTQTPETERITSHISPWLTAIAYPLGKYLVLPSYFSKIEIIGQEHLPRTGPVIIAPTHRSRWDSLIVPYAVGHHVIKRHLRFMVSANEMKGIQGWFIRRLGGFPVDTEQPGIGSFRHTVELLLAGEMLVIFPEGNIFRDNQLSSLKPGLVRMACHAQAKIDSKAQEGVKIVPMSIRYSQAAPKFGCQVKIHIGAPLEVNEFDVKKSMKVATQRLTTALETSLMDLDLANPPLFVGT